MTEHIQQASLTTNVNIEVRDNNTSPEVTTVAATDALAVTSPAVPPYLSRVYYWSYLNPRNVYRLDNEWVVRAILWCQHNRLKAAALSEIKPGQRVLQTAAVYGSFSKDLSRHLGDDGRLEVIDVAPIQVALTNKKMAFCENSKIRRCDASRCHVDVGTDVILSYFLLHEVPDDVKTRILDNLLSQLPRKAKLVIVDYHKPHAFHPLKPLMSLIFDWLEPFAKTFWRKDIKALASHGEQFVWQKTTVFGGLYQKLVVTHKNSEG